MLTEGRMREPNSMHAFSHQAANADEVTDALPPPKQYLLTVMTEPEVAELIERHIDFVDASGRSVHLASPFVRHFMQRHDKALPTVVAIATLPLILADGAVLAKQGLDRDRGILFKLPEASTAIVPAASKCGEAAVVEALRFLTDGWLADVATDYAGKCILVAVALTIIERSLLPDRPAFFVTAGRRGRGKTTTLTILSVAAVGTRPPAAAWSPNEEERRKALLVHRRQCPSPRADHRPDAGPARAACPAQDAARLDQRAPVCCRARCAPRLGSGTSRQRVRLLDPSWQQACGQGSSVSIHKGSRAHATLRLTVSGSAKATLHCRRSRRGLSGVYKRGPLFKGVAAAVNPFASAHACRTLRTSSKLSGRQFLEQAETFEPAQLSSPRCSTSRFLDANATRLQQGGPVGSTCRRIVGIHTLPLMPFGLVMADHATSRSARQAVMTRIVAGDATHYGALDATLGVSTISADH
jgi:hypothetical protein